MRRRRALTLLILCIAGAAAAGTAIVALSEGPIARRGPVASAPSGKTDEQLRRSIEEIETERDPSRRARLVTGFVSEARVVGARMAPESKRALLDLLARIEPPPLRVLVGRSLGQCRNDPELVSHLISMLDGSSDPATLRGVCEALRDLRDERAAPALVARAERADDEELAPLLRALGRIGGPAVRPAFLRAARRRLAPAARKALTESWPDADLAADALPEAADEMRPVLLEIIARSREPRLAAAALAVVDGDPAASDDALRAAVACADGAVFDRLIELAGRRPDLAASIADAAARLRRPEALAAAARRWSRCDPAMRHAVLNAAGRVTTPPRHLVDLAATELSSDDLKIRRAAARLLGRAGAVAPLQRHLVEAAGDDDFTLAVHALYSIRSKEAARGALDALESATPARRARYEPIFLAQVEDRKR